MKISVDRDRFDQAEDDGTVVLLRENPDERLHDAVRTAEQVCPASAIRSLA